MFRRVALDKGKHLDNDKSVANTVSKSSNNGIVPEGIWVLDQERSNKLIPSSHTLWILKDDGQELRWVSVETGADGADNITSWAGKYDGEPSTVAGSGFVASVRTIGPRTMETYGEIPDMGPFTERCEVAESGREMICNGRVETSEGVQTWREVFTLFSDSPHKPFQTTDC